MRRVKGGSKGRLKDAATHPTAVLATRSSRLSSESPQYTSTARLKKESRCMPVSREGARPSSRTCRVSHSPGPSTSFGRRAVNTCYESCYLLRNVSLLQLTDAELGDNTRAILCQLSRRLPTLRDPLSEGLYCSLELSREPHTISVEL